MFGIPERTLPPACVLKAPLDRRRLYAVIRRMAEVAGVPCPDTALLDDRGMEALQAAYLGRSGPTNILSFPAPNGPTALNEQRSPAWPDIGPTVLTGPGRAGEVFRGCLALSVDTLERETFLYGQEAAAYCIRLLAHGLAHLAGCDHGPAMRELEERLERAGAQPFLDPQPQIRRHAGRQHGKFLTSVTAAKVVEARDAGNVRVERLPAMRPPYMDG